MWTEAAVRAALPPIKVKLAHDVIVDAVMLGRKNKYATVSWQPLGSATWANAEVCWATVTNCLNGNRPVIVELE